EIITGNNRIAIKNKHLFRTMLKMICNIKIKGKDNKIIRFDYCNSIEVRTSCKNLTDTATVKVPKKMFWREKPLTDFIGRGNEIEIEAGYEEYGLQTLFRGWITGVENSYPLIINCENEMWKFKTVTVPAEIIKKFNLKDYLQKYGGVQVDVAENLSFGSMDIKEEMSLAQAVDLIMQSYPYVVGYFQDGIFKAFLSSDRWAKGLKPVTLSPERNMVANSLKYTLADDIKICLKAVSIKRDNTQIVAFAPANAYNVKTDKKGKTTHTQKDGWEQRQEFCPQLTTQREVQDYADKRAAEWITDKMEGSVTLFGVPFIRKGDLVKLQDRDRTERDGKKFIVDAVDYSFGTDGYRQTVTLGYAIV
ncbi:MAG: hypothetical protein LBG92_07990, partial [Prevotellaceae bacterium]|nr:hypothetical protein [Prevotellaceae bacterium]